MTTTTRQSDRLAKIEAKAFPPPTQQMRLGFRLDTDPELPYPADLGPDDMFIEIVGVGPTQAVSP